jgi:dolichol-phosphate mannosyltransferase
LPLGAERICQMDADLSHDPEYLPALVDATEHADVAVGSRYQTGVSVANWPLRRLFLSLAANRYVRMITGLPVRDTTSGFKCWRRVRSRPYCNTRCIPRGTRCSSRCCFTPTG